jgi:ribosomal protein L44E
MKQKCSHCGTAHDTKTMRYSHFLTIGDGPTEEWLCRECAAAQDIRCEMVEVVGKIHRLELDDRYERRYKRLIGQYRKLQQRLDASTTPGGKVL